MASLINSIRNIMSDSLWMVKVAILSAGLFYVLYYSYDMPPNSPQYLICFAAIILALIGTSIFLVQQNIKNQSPILPGITSIPDICLKMFGGALSILPGAIIYYVVIMLLYDKLPMYFEWEDNKILYVIIYTIATTIISPLVFVPPVLYAAKGNLIHAFRYDVVLESAANFMVQFLSYLIQYIFIFVSFTLLIYFFLLTMFGDHVSLLILKSVVIVMTVLSAFSYFSDMYGDVIFEVKVKKKQQNPKKR